MRFAKSLRAAVLGVSTIALVGCAGAGGPPSGEVRTVAARTASDQRVGDQNHPKVLAEFGGEIQDEGLKRYVRDLGLRLAAQSEQPNAKWTFTVLDSPVVNAFALPGGYIYVTRGLLALANSEAELAGVIGHEIGHVTAEHGAQRQRRAGMAQLGIFAASIGGALLGLPTEMARAATQGAAIVGQGVVASYSRSQEFESDQLGVRYLARAGYDPEAQADFLASLQSETALQSRIAGRGYNPNRVDFFASHPATAERVREAIRVAGQAGVEGAPRKEREYLEQIDGMIYGDSPSQGFVKGRRFSHPELGFTFEAPEGFRIQNASERVVAVGPNNAALIFDGARYEGGSMEDYVARTWARGISEQSRTGRLEGLRSRTINGLPAASARMAVQTQNGVRILRLTAIRKGDTVYRFTGVQPQGATAIGDRMERAAGSFAALSAAEARRLKPYRIDIHRVRSGETISSLAAKTPFDDLREERFRVLNGLGRGEGLQAGQLVKLVRD